MRAAKAIELDAQTDRELRVLVQRKRVEVRLQQRARIVLLAVKGMQSKDIAVEVPGGHPNSPTHGHLKFPHPDRASMRR